MNRLDSYTPLGYSLCGVVVEVGARRRGVQGRPARRRAGNEFALHAEYNWVPVNLCAAVPDGRRARACRVRHRRARSPCTGCAAPSPAGRHRPGHRARPGRPARGPAAGRRRGPGRRARRDRGTLPAGRDRPAPCCARPRRRRPGRIEHALAELTGGRGADHVFLAAGGSPTGRSRPRPGWPGTAPGSSTSARPKLDLPWNAYYDKELDVRFSRSYGPGRYDDRYELEGIDYPAGYVRWTERRNLECFLDLVARGSLNIDLLVSESFDLSEATGVYERLSGGKLSGIGFLFEYPEADDEPSAMSRTPQVPPGPIWFAQSLQHGAAGFHRGRELRRRRCCSRTSPSSRDVQLAHVVDHDVAVRGQRPAALRLRARLDRGRRPVRGRFDRRHLRRHPPPLARGLGVPALDAGKAVFVEKPLALTGDQLIDILDVVATSGNDRLMVGFNRRFAPLLSDLVALRGDTEGAMVRYLVNAGTLGADSGIETRSWRVRASSAKAATSSTRLSGGSAPPRSRSTPRPARTHTISASRCATTTAPAGIGYVTTGNPRYPKETFEVAAAGRTARLDNFARPRCGPGAATTPSDPRVWTRVRGQVARFVEAVGTGGPMPIPLPSLVATTAATLAVGESLVSGTAVTL